MEVKHWIYLISNNNSYSALRRDIICISWWEPCKNIFLRIFFFFPPILYLRAVLHKLSSYLWLSIMMKNSKKGAALRRDIMLVHFEISTYFVLASMYGWYSGIFLQSLIICFPFFKVWALKKQDKDDFKPNLNLFLFLSRRNARATFWRY